MHHNYIENGCVSDTYLEQTDGACMRMQPLTIIASISVLERAALGIIFSIRCEVRITPGGAGTFFGAAVVDAANDTGNESNGIRSILLQRARRGNILHLPVTSFPAAAAAF